MTFSRTTHSVDPIETASATAIALEAARATPAGAPCDACVVGDCDRCDPVVCRGCDHGGRKLRKFGLFAGSNGLQGGSAPHGKGRGR